MEEARNSCVGPNMPLLHWRRSLFGSRPLWLIVEGTGGILLRLIAAVCEKRPARGAGGRLFLVTLFVCRLRWSFRRKLIVRCGRQARLSNLPELADNGREHDAQEEQKCH